MIKATLFGPAHNPARCTPHPLTGTTVPIAHDTDNRPLAVRLHFRTPDGRHVWLDVSRAEAANMKDEIDRALGTGGS